MAFELSRRSFLAATAGSVGVTIPTARSAEKNEQTNYVLEQGDSCVPVVPLSGDQPVEEFYDYRTPSTDPKSFKYASFGTTDLQRENTSIVFLYDGPEGLSLVVVHGKLGADDDDGGSVTMGFASLTGGEWAVGDDIYDADTNYDEFGQTDDGWRVDWTYAGGRTDGGAYRGLGEDFEVTVTPNFNEEANLYGEHYDGTIEDWQLLSGDRSSPERTSLSMSEPVTIRAGQCGSSGSGGSGDEKKDESGPVNANVTLVQDRVNPKSNGRIQVALRSSATFDATTLDVGTATFGPNDAHPKHAETTDVNGDGRPDLLLHFRVADTGVSWETGAMTLEAKTDEGRTVTGEVDVEVVPQNGKKGGDDKQEDEKENC